MFDNSRFFDIDEALIRVLNLLANVAEIDNVKKYVFDSTDHTFKPRRGKGINSKKQIFTSRAKKQLSKIKLNWDIITIVVFLSSSIILTITATFALQISSKTPSSWIQALVILVYISLVGLLVSTILLLALIVNKIIKSGKEPGRRIIKNAVEDVIAYQPVIREIYAVAQNSQQTLKNAESVIKNLIGEIQTKEKKDSYLLSIMVFGYLVLAISFVFPIQFLDKNSLNNLVTLQNISIAIGITGFIISIIKALIESRSQSQILKLRKCLFLLEQAQARANNIDQQVIPVESTKLRPRFGSAKGLVEMTDDFDAPLTDFDDYMP